MKTVVLTILVTFAGIAEAAPARLVHTISHIVTKINSEGWAWSRKLATSQASKTPIDKLYSSLREKGFSESEIAELARAENPLEYAVRTVNSHAEGLANIVRENIVIEGLNTKIRDNIRLMLDLGRYEDIDSTVNSIDHVEKIEKLAQKVLKEKQDEAVEYLLDVEEISLDDFLEAIPEP